MVLATDAPVLVEMTLQLLPEATMKRIRSVYDFSTSIFAERTKERDTDTLRL